MGQYWCWGRSDSSSVLACNDIFAEVLCFVFIIIWLLKLLLNLPGASELNITLIFDSWLHRYAVMIPMKYEFDSGDVTDTFAKAMMFLIEKLTNEAVITPITWLLNSAKFLLSDTYNSVSFGASWSIFEWACLVLLIFCCSCFLFCYNIASDGILFKIYMYFLVKAVQPKNL